MSKTITVSQGDCLINLSHQEGFFWETIWNHPQNADLQKRRNHLNIIKPGDQVFIPDKAEKSVDRPTDQLHRFVRKGCSTRFTITLLDRGKPRANQRYVFVAGSISREGTTDESGTLTEPIPPNVREGRLIVGDKRQEIALSFGYVDPVDEISGVKGRLQNLGFYHGEIDDELTPETSWAIAEFQRSAELAGQGELTDETRQELVNVHGS